MQQAAGNQAVARLVADELPVVARAKQGAPNAGQPRRSGRLAVQTPATTSRLAAQVVWVGPVYGGSDGTAGGSFVLVTLGPAAGRPTNYGSAPGRQECIAVNRLNAGGFLGKQWVKGHLVNDNLGGQGVSRNLTPMSHHANMRFKGRFEGPVKRALTQAYTDGQRTGTHWYGVTMTVVVNTPGRHAGTAAQRAIAESVTATAHWVERPRGSGADTAIAAPPWRSPAFSSPLTVTVQCDL